MNEFTPKRIGKRDIEKEQKIVQLYFDLCNHANELLMSLDSYLGYLDKDHLYPDVFFEFMSCNDPKAFLYSKYIDNRGITFPGISISKVIELGLADVPLERFADLLENRTKLLKSIQSTGELKFHYPLAKLWDITIESFFVIDIDDDHVYTIASTDFESKLTQHTGRFTVSESDNAVLEAIEETIDSFNKLIRLGVIKNDKGRWSQGVAQLANAIVFNRNDENPLSVNPILNRLHDFRRFFTEIKFNPVMGKPQDVLSFEPPAPDQPEDISEDLLQTEDIVPELVEEIIQTE